MPTEQEMTAMRNALVAKAELIRTQSELVTDKREIAEQKETELETADAGFLDTILNERFTLNNRLVYTNEDQRRVALTLARNDSPTYLQTRAIKVGAEVDKRNAETELEYQRRLYRPDELLMTFYANATSATVTEPPPTQNTTPPTPSAFVTDDSANTANWTNSAGFGSIADYQYTLDGGATAIDVTAKPQPIGDVARAVGQVGIRVRAASGRNASQWLFNTVAFTQSGGGSEPPTLTNFALASNGSIATASSSFDANHTAQNAINGVKHTNGNWSLPGGSWTSLGNPNAAAESLTVDFGTVRQISRVVIHTLTGNGDYSVEATDATMANQFGNANFTIEYYDGAKWTQIAAVTGNDKARRQFDFTAVSATKIRATITAAPTANAYIVELEGLG